MPLHWLAPLLAAAAALASAAAAPRAPLTVQTSSGRVTGVRDEALGLRKFLGVPFAEPPLGDLRWRPPRPLEDRWDADVSAAEWRDSMTCAQLRDDGSVMGSEDCLYLNVIAPDRPSPVQSLPVLVWIYGGSFTGGSAGRPEYSGQHMVADNHDVIHVALNYRLGAFGFTALPGLAEEHPGGGTGGMLGLEDQRAGLAWVRANIAAFGGDPERVTVQGQSAGGISVCLHLASPLSAGLFRAAILESGPCDGPVMGSRAAGEYQGRAFASASRCNTSRTDAARLECMRGLSTAQLVEDAIAAKAYHGFTPESFGASVDGYNLPRLPRDQFLLGVHNRVPLLIGSNHDEMGLFVPNNPDWLGATAESLEHDIRAYLASQGATADLVEQAVEFYRPSRYNDSAVRALVAMRSHSTFVCGSRRTQRYVTAHPAAPPVFSYSFTHRPEHGSLAGPKFAYTGAFHQAELISLLGNLPVDHDLVTSFSPAELRMNRAMRRYWLNFVNGLNPNSLAAPQPRDVASPRTWDQYSRERDNVLVIDTEFGAADHGEYIDAGACDIWDRVVLIGAPVPYTDAGGLTGASTAGGDDDDDDDRSKDGGSSGPSAVAVVAMIFAVLALVAALVAALAVSALSKRNASRPRQSSQMAAYRPPAETAAGGGDYARMDEP